MKQYIGTKVVNATPMTRAEYNRFRGWTFPEDEDGSDQGFLVEYLDGGKANTPHYKGYVSWSPKDVFEKSYSPSAGLSYGLALEAAKLGKRISREGWNGKNMFVFQRPAAELSVRDVIEVVQSVPHSVKKFLDEKYNGDYLKASGNGEFTVKFLPYLCMYSATGEIVNGWLASQTDMLSNDWCILD